VEEWLPLINTILTLALGGAGTLLARWVVPRIRNVREVAETNKIDAETIGLYRDEVAEMRQESKAMWTEIRRLNVELAEFRAHIDDLHSSIGQEADDIKTRILSRLRTIRPNGERSKQNG
jgi:hypothetical protein